MRNSINDNDSQLCCGDTKLTGFAGTYSLEGIGVNYDLMKDLSLKTGVTNLFDKQIYRENEGASTYNEPGRAYYAGLTLSF